MKHLILILVLVLAHLSAKAATISGIVRDEKGVGIPFATVYIQGTTLGTTANLSGNYSLDLVAGNYQIVFQSIGFNAQIKTVTILSKNVVLDIALQPTDIILNEVVIRANAEDPAYRIIRPTIQARKAHLLALHTFSCDVYIKGNQQIKNAPSKIMGREIGDLGGGLDSTRSGIVYLSESVSKLYYEAPDTYKEVMVSSRVAGNSAGFSFNQAQAMSFNFYQNQLDFQTKFISPIADDALAYYKYQLINSFKDKDGRSIAKIKVLPRNTYAPTFGGYIYIVEGAWTIYATDLYVTKAASGIDFLDTLYIRQTHLPQGENWLLFQQSLSFGVKLLNIDTKGVFLAVFSNYALNPTFAPHFFTKEILKVEAAANEKTVAYWDSIRPVPLTLEEQKGYVKKDSLQTIRQTKTYLDSMDARRNRFAVINLLIGYTYRQSYQKRSFTLSSPINTLQYNTVQGYHATLDAAFRQNYDDYRIRWWRVGANVSYALAEARARVAGSATYHFNRLTNAELSISGGEELAQYNAENPISPTLNTVYTLLAAQNYIKLYDKKFVAASYEQEVWEGGQLRAAISYADRAVAVPHSATTWLTHAGRELADNTPYHSATEPTETLYAPSRALLVSAQLQLKFNQSFIMYPARKITVDDPLYPVVSVQYSGGLGDAPYHKLAGQVTYDLPTGIVGTLSLNATGGYFLQAAPRFYDWQHFSGNQTLFGNPNRYLTNFKLLPYYTQSVGKGYYAEAHLEQDFGSFFFNKIPLLKQLNLTTLAGANVLYTQQTQTPYYEWSVGIGNIGWSVFRIFRIDFAMGRAAGGAWQQGVIIGVKL